jgi:hypothetical protein
VLQLPWAITARNHKLPLPLLLLLLLLLRAAA